MWRIDDDNDDAGVATLAPGAPVAPAPGPDPDAPRPVRSTAAVGADRWFPLGAFAAVGGTVFAVSVLAFAFLPRLHPFHRQLMTHGWADAFGWWDGWWYVGIARRGYRFFAIDRQSPVAFFPAYPLVMRGLGSLVWGPLVAGIAVTLASGAAVAVLFHRWAVDKLGTDRARLALLLLLLYPFAFYLMGAVYADALFLAAALGAFVALERDRPVVAGLAAALATAARPVGVALILGLWILALERKGLLGRMAPRRGSAGLRGRLRGRFRPGDAGLLLAPFGMASFCAFLWARFGNPVAFLETAGAPGWDQPPGFHTWFKVHWVKAMWNGPWDNGHFGHLLVNALATVVVAAFIPRVFRRLGVGYGVFVVFAVIVTAVSTKDFVGMGRYTLAAFPCFAMAADVLHRRPALARATLVVSGAGLLMLAQLHARGTIVS